MGAALLAAGIGSRFLPGSSIAQVEGILRSIQDVGSIGVLAFIGIQILVAVSGLLPASLFGLAAGAVYGVPLGFGIAAFSTMIGAFIAFMLSRSLLRPTIVRLLQSRSRLQNFDALLARDGWRFVCLLRLSPIMPFAVTSYALGLSSIMFRDYWLGSLAALPSLLGYVFIGSLTTTGLAAISQGSSPLKWGLVGLGIVATALITWRIGKLAMLAGLTPAAPLTSD
ncbi:MAG: VTT domain-containing protein [Rhodopila sp.]|nr:VTT domain-containing protein [Rhodopila sp.]